MNKRPPFLGYNHNVRHKGRLFHVQTEDSGLSRPVLTTHVFVDGTILATMRAQYTTDEPDPVVQKRMQEQHKTMLKRVRDGEFDGHDDAPARPAAATPAPAAKPAEAAPAAKVEKAPEPAPSAPSMSPPSAVPPQRENSPSRKPGPPPPPARREGPGLHERQTAEIPRPAQSASEPAPAPAPQAGQGGLAARLGIGPAAPVGVVPPPPIGPSRGGLGAPAAASAKPGSGTVQIAEEEDMEPVVEMEVAPPSDDDEPAMTIEAAEPTEEETEAAELSKATPLPIAVPLVQDETFTMGAADLIPPPRTGPFTASAPFGSAVRPVRSTRPLANRPLHSGALRARPTSEGVVVLCMGPVQASLLRKQPAPRTTGSSPPESLRTTQTNLHPTTPSSLPPKGALLPAGTAVEDPRAFDDKLMAFLRREAAR